MRMMSNPSVRRWVAKSERGELNVEVQPATYKGVYGKTAILGVVTMVAAIAVELLSLKAIADGNYNFLIWAGIGAAVCFVPMIVLSLVMAFAPMTTKYLSIPYAIIQGGLLGMLSLFVDVAYPGIAFAAFLGTMIVFVVSVAVNKLFSAHTVSRLLRIFTVALFSVLFLQLVMFLLSRFNVFQTETGWTVFNWIEVGVSAVCILWASVLITFDLKNIDFCVQSGCDKRYEWSFAFSLLTSLVYLYIEILELLVRLLILFKKDN